MRSAPRGVACQPRSLLPALWRLETGIQAIQLSPCTPYSVLSTELRRPISRRFPACSGPVPLSRSQSFPTPVSRVSKSPTSRLRSFEHSLLLHATTAHAFRLRSLAQIMCRSPEALALGAAGIACRRRYHCPERGCLVNRSRDCSRLGARGHFMPRVAITAPSSAAFSLASLRFGASRRDAHASMCAVGRIRCALKQHRARGRVQAGLVMTG